MSLRTGLQALAKVIRIFGYIVGGAAAVFGAALAVLEYQKIGLDSGLAVKFAIIAIIGGLLVVACWVVAYVIDAFGKDDY